MSSPVCLFSDEIEEVLSQGSGQDTDDEYPSDFEEYDSDDVNTFSKELYFLLILMYQYCVSSYRASRGSDFCYYCVCA